MVAFCQTGVWQCWVFAGYTVASVGKGGILLVAKVLQGDGWSEYLFVTICQMVQVWSICGLGRGVYKRVCGLIQWVNNFYSGNWSGV